MTFANLMQVHRHIIRIGVALERGLGQSPGHNRVERGGAIADQLRGSGWIETQDLINHRRIIGIEGQSAGEQEI